MGDEAASGTEFRSIWTELRGVAFTQSWLDAGGVRTRYVEAGPSDAPAVLMLHGTGAHWETFVSNLGPLSERFRCIAIDMVGNGFTEKPDYPYDIAAYVQHAFGVLDALGVEQTSLIGTSLGSWVAARMALDRPERVNRLVLCSPAGLIATASNMARIRAERTEAVRNPTWESIKAIFDHLIQEEHNRIPDMIALRQAIYRQPETLQTIDHVLVLQDAEVRERNLLSEQEWASIQAPSLVIASGKDHNEYQSTANRISEMIPEVEVLNMPHVKHWPHFEDPGTFNEAALTFLGKG